MELISISLLISGMLVHLVFLILQVIPVTPLNKDILQCRSKVWNQNDPEFKFEIDSSIEQVPCLWIDDGKNLVDVLSRRAQTCDTNRNIRRMCPHSCGKCCGINFRINEARDECHKSQICEELMKRDCQSLEEGGNSVSIPVPYVGTLGLTPSNDSNVDNLALDESYKEAAINELNKLYKAGIVGCDNRSETQNNIFEENNIVCVEFLPFETSYFQNFCHGHQNQGAEASACVKIGGKAKVSFVTTQLDNDTVTMKNNLVATIQNYLDTIQPTGIDAINSFDLTFIVPQDELFECKMLQNRPDVKEIEIRAYLKGPNYLNEWKSLLTMNEKFCPKERIRNLMAYHFKVDPNDHSDLIIVESNEQPDLIILGVEIQSIKQNYLACKESMCKYVANGKVYFSGDSTDNSLLVRGTSSFLKNAVTDNNELDTIEIEEITLLESLLPETGTKIGEETTITANGKGSLGTYLMIGFVCVTAQAAVFFAMYRRLVHNREQEWRVANHCDDKVTIEYKSSYIVRNEKNPEDDMPIDSSNMNRSRSLESTNIYVSFPVNGDDPMSPIDVSFISDEYGKTYDESNIECIALQNEGKKKRRMRIWGRKV